MSNQLISYGRTKFSSTEAAILQAFIKLCHKLGPHNVTLQKVAKEARVAFGTVRYHFAGPELDLHRSAIFYAILIGQQYIHSWLEERRFRPDFNGVHEYIRGTFQWYKMDPATVSYVFNFYYLCTTKVDLVIDNKRFLETARGRIEALFFESVGRGQYPHVTHSQELAKLIQAVVAGGVLMAATSREPKELEVIQEITVRSVDAVICAQQSRTALS